MRTQKGWREANGCRTPIAQSERGTSSHRRQAGKVIAAVAGNIQPSQLRASHVVEINERITKGSGYAHTTKVVRCAAARQLLRWLWEYYGAPKLDGLIVRTDALRPRNVTANHDEKTALLDAAPPHLRLWILFCSDLAIRSGTAARIAPEHYDADSGILHFTTKKGARQTLPVTQEIRELLDHCDREDSSAFVQQLKRHERRRGPMPSHGPASTSMLNREFAKLRRALGITRKLTLHDLRRTTAVAMLQHTHDIRDVQALLGHRSLQSTIWYLDHDLRPVKRHHLEIIKRQPAAESDTLTA